MSYNSILVVEIRKIIKTNQWTKLKNNEKDSIVEWSDTTSFKPLTL